MRSQLFAPEHVEAAPTGLFTLQNAKLLKVALGGGGGGGGGTGSGAGEVLARQGSMVAYQGRMDFDREGSGSVGRFFKKAFTGEGVPLMRVSGQGDLFLAHDADEVHLIHLDDDALTVNGANILAFEPSLSWDIRRVEGVGMLSGGMFNTLLSGTGWVAITAHGTPVVLQTDAPTYADVQSAIAWSATLQTGVQRSAGVKAAFGLGSGEAFQLAFSGQGFVIVQASEGPAVPPHSHGG